MASRRRGARKVCVLYQELSENQTAVNSTPLKGNAGVMLELEMFRRNGVFLEGREVERLAHALAPSIPRGTSRTTLARREVS